MSTTHVAHQPQPSVYESKAEADAAALRYANGLADSELAEAIRDDPAQGCFDCSFDEVDMVLVRCKWHWRGGAYGA